MDFGYKQTRILTTADLPGVYCEPPITFEVLNSPSFDFTKMLFVWASDDEQNESLLKQLAAKLIVSVTNSRGERYEMGTIENIEAFIEATSLDFLHTVVRSWTALIAQERIETKKKLPTSRNHYDSIKAKNSQAEPSLSD